ncbi:MAG: DUF4345 domain-containing protein [Sphingomonadales bacterium]
MIKHFPQRLLLGAAGGLLVFIGVSIFADPQGFAASNGIHVDMGPSLRSELRAPSGSLITSGLFMLISVARLVWLKQALVLAGAIYASYGVSRTIGVIADGLPSASLTQAMSVELILGALCLTVAYRFGRFGRLTPIEGRA